MPCIIVHRNFEINSDQEQALQEKMSTITQDVLGKPDGFIMVIIDPPKAIRFGGTNDPALFVEYKSIGLPGNSTEELSKAICAYAEEDLSVPAGRIYIEFADSPGKMWGWNGRTF